MEKNNRTEHIKIRKKYLVYDIIIYGSVALLVIWLILKAIGIINSPEYQKIMPVLLGILAFVGVVAKFGKAQGDVQSNMNWLKRCFVIMDKRQNKMAAALVRVEKDFEYMKKDMDRFDKRFDDVESKMDRLTKCKNYRA